MYSQGVGTRFSGNVNGPPVEHVPVCVRSGALQYSLSVGTTGPGSFNVYSQGQAKSCSATVGGRPVDDSPV